MDLSEVSHSLVAVEAVVLEYQKRNSFLIILCRISTAQLLDCQGFFQECSTMLLQFSCFYPYGTVKTLNIGTPRLNTVAVLNIKQFNFTMK